MRYITIYANLGVCDHAYISVRVKPIGVHPVCVDLSATVTATLLLRLLMAEGLALGEL